MTQRTDWGAWSIKIMEIKTMEQEKANMAARYEHEIPEGYEARIEGNKVIIELKENEDEKIRTRLIALVEAFGQGAYKNEMLTYLEKQKDQDVKVISWREPDDCADIPEGHYVVIAYKPGVFGLGYIGNGKVVCAPGQKPSGILYIPNADESIIVESKEQKPAEWSDEDEKMKQRILTHLYSLIYPNSLYGEDASECISWLKSLCPQPSGNFAISFMNYLDEHRPDGKMCLSNGECADIETAFKKEDWAKVIRYVNKYQPHWKPSEEQMKALNDVANDGVLLDLFNDLLKLV